MGEKNKEKVEVLEISNEFEKFDNETIVSATLFQLWEPCLLCNPIGYCDCGYCARHIECHCKHLSRYRSIVVSVQGRPIVKKPSDCDYVVRIHAGEAKREDVHDILKETAPQHTLVLQANTLDDEAHPYRKILAQYVQKPEELLLRPKTPRFRAPFPIESYTGQLLTTLRKSLEVKAVARSPDENPHVQKRKKNKNYSIQRPADS